VPDPERLAVAFARVLRGAGLDVPVGNTIAFAQALGEVGLADRAPVYWAGRATLVRRPEDAAVFDRAFAAFWLGDDVGALSAVHEESVVLAMDDGLGDAGDAIEPERGDARPTLSVRYSATEVLRHKDFAAYSNAELREARRLMADLRLVGARRRSRRAKPVARGGHSARPDLRRTVRHALRSGGEPIRRAWRAPSTRPRSIVLLCDVSGSMEPYARALLRFVHAAVVGRGRVEAFALGTRLTRLTRELSTRDPDEALTRAGGAVPDWSGGTRLGDGIRAFNDQWGVRGMARGATVVVLSDGWDRGAPEVLAEQMARLHRVAHRVVWVNPLKASPGYAPLAQGMAAAMPYVDEFVEGHSLASLEVLAEVLSR
jgi:uncharacterized protein with von Willebrand factor type A (vWA) domain